LDFSFHLINLNFEDVYLVLKSSDFDREFKSIGIGEMQTVKCYLDSNIYITLEKFEMSQKQMDENNQPLFGAIVNFKCNGKESLDTIYTKMKNSSQFKGIIWKKIPNTDYDIAFWSFVPAQSENARSEAAFTFKKSNEEFVEPKEILTMEASFKPFISFVWIGVIVIVIGFVISFVKNLKEKNDELSN
jgi:hypothetical protein